MEKKAQLAAKKISKEYKKIREANAKKKDNRTLQQLIDDDFIPIEKNNKNIKQIIDDRTYQQLKDDGFIALESDEDIEPITHVRKKKKKELQKIETNNEIEKLATNRSKTMAANKILKKFKNMKKTKKNFLVNEEDLEIINYNKNDQEISDFSEPEDLL